jgi:hypothetical protein
MTTIFSASDYSLLFGGSSNAAGDILSALYSGTTATPGATTATSTGNPIVDLQLAEKNQAQAVAQQAKSPTVVRDLAAFTSAVANAKDITSALQNPNVLKVLLTANGMADQIQYPALAAKALMSDPNSDTSLANTLGDTRWKNVAASYDFAAKGLAALQDPTVQSQLAQAYEQVTWMSSLDAATPGLSYALTFKKQASSITNVDQILGDPVNRQVVLTALGIPQQVAYQDLPAQEQAVSSRLDITNLQNPSFINKLTDRYLLAMQQQSQSSSSGTSMEALAVQSIGLIV